VVGGERGKRREGEEARGGGGERGRGAAAALRAVVQQLEPDPPPLTPCSVVEQLEPVFTVLFLAECISKVREPLVHLKR
jgi:hypothetical protein